MRKQFPLARKLRTAFAEALLVIINTKSFQPQPQFPKEKKKEPEQNYDQFWTPSESILGRDGSTNKHSAECVYIQNGRRLSRVFIGWVLGVRAVTSHLGLVRWVCVCRRFRRFSIDGFTAYFWQSFGLRLILILVLFFTFSWLIWT